MWKTFTLKFPQRPSSISGEKELIEKLKLP